MHSCLQGVSSIKTKHCGVIVLGQFLRDGFSQSGVLCQGNSTARGAGAAEEFGGSVLLPVRSLLGSFSSPSRAGGAGAAWRVLLRGTRTGSVPLRSQLLAFWGRLLELGRSCSLFSVIPLATRPFPASSSWPCLLLRSQQMPNSVSLPDFPTCSVVLPHFQ